MNEYDKLYKKLQQKYTIEEIADGYMIPNTLPPEEQKKAHEEFLKIRLEKWNNRTPEEILFSEIVRLWLSIEDYLKQETYQEAFSFANLIERYLQILQKSKADFAKDIDITEAELKQLMNGKTSDIHLMYRLEKHSNKHISASCWWKVLARQIEQQLAEDEAQRLEESQKVNNAVTV